MPKKIILLTGKILSNFFMKTKAIATLMLLLLALPLNLTITAIAMFYNHPDIAQAYLDQEPLTQTAQPLPTSRPTYWIYHKIWRLLTHLWSTPLTWQRLQIINQGKDAIFDWDDPLPFLLVHHWQIPLLLLGNLRHPKKWIRIDFNIGKLVEVGGD
jgi:hypothetical protein